jgi:hypothetical protein
LVKNGIPPLDYYNPQNRLNKQYLMLKTKINYYSIITNHLRNSVVPSLKPVFNHNSYIYIYWIVKTITGWWYTYPSEKYYPVGSIIPRYGKSQNSCSKPPIRLYWMVKTMIIT